jgi:hypothetical protein
MVQCNDVMFNTVKPPPIVSERTVKNKLHYTGKQKMQEIYLELFGENCTKIITTGQIFFRITNY